MKKLESLFPALPAFTSLTGQKTNQTVFSNHLKNDFPGHTVT